jgi:hypothetical protein
LHQQRVVAAVEKQLKKLKGEDEAAATAGMGDFRKATAAFGKGNCTAEQFRDALCGLLTPEFTGKLVPELAKIIPGDGKKEALLAAHAQATGAL